MKVHQELTCNAMSKSSPGLMQNCIWDVGLPPRLGTRPLNDHKPKLPQYGRIYLLLSQGIQCTSEILHSKPCQAGCKSDVPVHVFP
jgi:hypothetical protein